MIAMVMSSVMENFGVGLARRCWMEGRSSLDVDMLSPETVVFCDYASAPGQYNTMMMNEFRRSVRMVERATRVRCVMKDDLEQKAAMLAILYGEAR